jgi:hypothetical protein
MENVEPDTHWHEWREAAKKTGLTAQLQRAAAVLEELDKLTAWEVEQVFEQMSE